MGRGFKGAFRGRNIHPGKYVHKDVLTDQFSIRVVRDGVIHTQVRVRGEFEIFCFSLSLSLPLS